MLPRNHTDRIQIAFDDHRLVANAGLILPATLAQHLGFSQLVQEHLDLGNAPGRANTGDKVMTLVASALAGGDCIDAADALCTGGGGLHPGRHGQGAIHPPLSRGQALGAFLRSFRWGHVRQLDRGEPRVAGPGLGGWGRTRRRTIHHRPRFDHLRDLRPSQGGRPPPRLPGAPWVRDQNQVLCPSHSYRIRSHSSTRIPVITSTRPPHPVSSNSCSGV